MTVVCPGGWGTPPRHPAVRFEGSAQAVLAFVMVQAALNWLVDNYPGLADRSSSVDCVAAVLHAFDEIEALPLPAPPPQDER